jgi:tetratricopeptide (TPR) repeat protein
VYWETYSILQVQTLLQDYITDFGGLDVGADMTGMSVGSLMKKAKPRDPEGAVQAYTAGVTAQEQGDMEEAVRQYEASVEMDPTVAATQNALAAAYYAVGRYQESLAAYDAALQIEPNPDLQRWVDEFRASLAAPAA